MTGFESDMPPFPGLRETPVRIAPGLWSSLPPDQQTAPYDRHAAGYDMLIGSPLYHRPAWGAWPSCHAAAARDALADAQAGPILDCGCGSLLFTADTYRTLSAGRTTFLDRSLAMLRRGQRRLPDGHFLQGSALDLPFREGTFSQVLCWGTLHVLGTPSGLIAELRRVAMPGGRVALSTLVRGDRWLGEYMLGMLHRKGELAAPETEAAVTDAFTGHFEFASSRRIGNLLFLTGFTR